MDFELSQEQKLLRDTMRGFVERELYPHEERVEREDKVAPEIVAEIKRKAMELGLYAANMPEEIGGGGLNTLDTTILEMELGRASMARNMLVHRPSNILQACIGNQVEEYLLPTIRGDRLEALAMTEPGAGSDLRSMKCSARRDGDDYVIVFVATGEEDTSRGPKKLITSFLIDKGTPGFEVRDGYRSVSHRGYHNCILTFDDCRVPASKMLGEEHRGFAVANEWLGATRVQVAAMCLGRAHRAMELAAEWSATREQFGQTIGKFQGTSFKLADMATGIAAAEFPTYHAAWPNDRGEMSDQDAAMAKLMATEVLAKTADDALQIYGAMGLMDELPLERIWRDARVERIWEGTRDRKISPYFSKNSGIALTSTSSSLASLRNCFTACSRSGLVNILMMSPTSLKSSSTSPKTRWINGRVKVCMKLANSARLLSERRSASKFSKPTSRRRNSIRSEYTSKDSRCANEDSVAMSRYSAPSTS